MASKCDGFTPDGTKTAEALFFHHLQFEDLQHQARCSAGSIVRLACMVALHAYTSAESTNIAFQDRSKAWSHCNSNLPRRSRILELLRDTESSIVDSTKLVESVAPRHALSVSALEDDLSASADPTSLCALNNIFPEVELLFVVSWDPFAKGILLKCEYSMAIHTDWQARRILATFRQVLRSMVLQPHARLSDLDLLNEGDYHQLLEWNSCTPTHISTCVQDMVAKHVHAAPLSPAVDAWDGKLSYAELDEASTKVAHELSRLGAGTESAVALFFEKSRWNIVATLAVLKAGAAFVPLDPSQPDGRISHILKRIRAKVVLTSETYTHRLRGFADGVLTLNESLLQSRPSPSLWNPSPSRPWDLAYIMFTSGSTGEPKGVMIEHSACAASVVAHGQATGFNSKTRAIQYARHTFDASIAEILTPLAFGGCVVVPSDYERMNNITAVMQEKGVNWAFFTPSLIRLLEPSELPGLQTIALGGEPVGQDNIEQWAPGRSLVIAYGPTENTVFSTMYPVPTTGKAGIIGRGLGTLCWISDPEDPGRLSPLGATGELLLESPQLARGYLNFAENEGPNQAFVCDTPWLAKQGRRSRLYRTGDLCRFDENGIIHYEGRKDRQLKISGQRLEASEVEHHLRAAFGTSEIVVDVLTRPARGVTQKTKVLVAFVCLGKTSEDSDSNGTCVMPRPAAALLEMIPGVETQIAGALPSWMCPSVYIPLSTLPLSSNGKADVKRLRQEYGSLTMEQFHSFTQLEQPETLCERPGQNAEQLRLLRELWIEVLGVHEAAITPRSNFFRLGGDSLAAISLVTAARKRGLQLEFAQIFKNPVLGDLCDALVESKDSDVTLPPRPFELLGYNSDILDEIAEECSINTEDIEDAFPCTPLQEGLMALSSTTANSFLVQYALHLPPDVDVARLKMAWEVVSKAHGILRTRLVETLAAGIQQVVVREDLAWGESFDLDEYLATDAKRPSGFGDALNRFEIIYDSHGTACQLVWTVHHALADGHSVGLTLRSVRDAFNGALGPAGASFCSFVKYYKSMDSESAAKYWSAVFEDGNYEAFPKKALRTARISGDEQAAFIRRRVPLPSSTTGATATTILRAAWALVISRFSGNKDAVFGITSSGRNASFEGVESILGPVIATVPLRVNCNGKKTSHELLRMLQMSTVDMIPFEQFGMQNIARVDAKCRAACEFQSMMIVQPDVDMAVDGTPFTAIDRPQDLDKFNSHAIMMECNLKKEGVFLNINYDTQYLDPFEMERLVDYFENALEFLTSDEDRRIESFLGELTSKDILQIQEWNRRLPQTTEACVHQRFEEHVLEQPHAQAIFAWDGCLSFSELNTRASQLARVLLDLGVGPEKKVAYCFEKSMYTVVSMLAILKAGGAMVPLDPAHPPERKKFILGNIEANLVLASPRNADSFQDMDVQVVIVEPALFTRLNEIETAPFSSREVQPNNAATVLFTSGSTGTPKGVVQEHRTLCSAAIAHSEGMRMFKSSRILQFSSHIFDVSIIEIVNALVLGSCLCIPSEEDRMNNLSGFISRSQADWAFFTPSFARTLNPRDLPSMKTVVMGGEAMTLESIHTWAEHVQLINGYGPCEASVCTAADLTSGDFGADCIGRGVNCLVWIVDPDDHAKLLPIGSVGEILVEGPNVARGYLGDPDKTAKSFISSPGWVVNFESNDGNRRMYKTGDLGRLNPDGTVSYFGRKDFQIKLRGQRVEPGEVEHHLGRFLPSDSIVAVDAVTLPGSSNKSLVAFIELGNCSYDLKKQQDIVEGLFEQATLQLSTVLPAYMVPSHFIAVESIPFGATEKLDRRALRENATSLFTESSAGLSETETSAPMDSLQPGEDIALKISDMLANLLAGGDFSQVEALRGHNFNPYHAGMDSIQVISLSTFVRKIYGVSLPIQKYMNSAATIRDIAQWVVDDRRISQDDEGIDLLREIEVHGKPLAVLPLPQAEGKHMFTPRTVLLTGATGFLGNQLLAQLLQRAETEKVVALVRGQDALHATERLLSLARCSAWWRDEYTDRLEVWHGDLSLPRLGLGDAEWSRLDGSSTDGNLIDAVIHNGAVVNWMADYQALTPANILSTVHILTALQKATAARPVRLTYVSGGHLSTSPDVVHEIAEELKKYPAYSQTKFVSEVLVARYADRLSQAGFGPLVSIVKPGLIMGSSSDGVSNTDDFLWRVTTSALDIGLHVGDEGDAWIAAAGVDLVAHIILDSCFNRATDGEHQMTRKILNGLTMGEYWDIVTQETDRAAKPTGAEAWLQALQGEVENRGTSHLLWPVMHFLEDTGGRLGQPIGVMTTEEQLEHQDLVRKALRKSLQYLVAIGYMTWSRSSSEDGDSASEPAALLSPGRVVFSRTPTTPVWNQKADSKQLGYGGIIGVNVKQASSVDVTTARPASLQSDATGF